MLTLCLATSSPHPFLGETNFTQWWDIQILLSFLILGIQYSNPVLYLINGQSCFQIYYFTATGQSGLYFEEESKGAVF